MRNADNCKTKRTTRKRTNENKLHNQESVRNGHDDTTEISRFVDILVCSVPSAVTCMLSSNCHTSHDLSQFISC